MKSPLKYQNLSPNKITFLILYWFNGKVESLFFNKTRDSFAAFNESKYSASLFSSLTLTGSYFFYLYV